MLPASMANLTPDQVRHIAKLARLTLSEAEVAKFATEMSAILQYVDMLQEVDTSAVEPTAQVTGQTNALREDVIKPNSTAPDALLECSPLQKAEHQIVTPSAHG
jgi:aspartyl-tRNA(Asn)/glutamyl-tRNA(Gln) amidotransferase subunit C